MVLAPLTEASTRIPGRGLSLASATVTSMQTWEPAVAWTNEALGVREATVATEDAE